MENKTNQVAVVVNGRDLPMSNKTAMILCKVIKTKKIEPSIKLLERVMEEKIGISFAKGKVKTGNNGLKYPVNAAGIFVKLLKSLSANATVKGLDPSKIIIHARADIAPRPNRPGRRPVKFKRTHVTLEGSVEKTAVAPAQPSPVTGAKK